MKVNATQELWEKWTDLQYNLQAISFIVQNPDTQITEEEYQSWYGKINLFLHRFNKLVDETDEAIEQ
jgi:hypothetical protein